METRDLTIVLRVAKLGSFAAAARALDLDPSSVSRTVAGVEAALGVRLFQRSTRRLAVTEEGEAYLARIGPLIEALAQASDDAGRLRQQPSGTLRLTAAVSYAQVCIVPHLAAFRALFPEIRLELIPSDENLDLLAEGIDLAIRLTASPQGAWIGSRLVRTRYRVVAAPRYLATQGTPAAPADLAGHDCLRFALPEFRTRWQFRKAGGEAVSVPVEGHLVIGGGLALRQAARDGLGPALLGDWLVDDDIAAGRLVDLFPGWDCTATSFDTGVWALYPSRAYLPRKVRAMIDFLRPRLAKQA